MRRYGAMIGVVLVAAGLVGTPQSTAAEERKVWPVCSRAGHDEATYATKAGTTLTRGAANTLFGWTELIRQPAAEVKAGGNVVTGIAKGVGYTVTRTVAGVAEILTFWAPKHRGIHLVNDCPICMKGK